MVVYHYQQTSLPMKILNDQHVIVFSFIHFECIHLMIMLWDCRTGFECGAWGLGSMFSARPSNGHQNRFVI